MKKISLENDSLHYSLTEKFYEVFPLQPNGQFIYCQGTHAVNGINFFLFQRATEGIESVAYKHLIAPFKKDLPVSELDGFRRVCADQKYAFVAGKIMMKYLSQNVSCQLVALPETSYPIITAFIISKSSPCKGVINWR
jgi:hypothetical protein